MIEFDEKILELLNVGTIDEIMDTLSQKKINDEHKVFAGRTIVVVKRLLEVLIPLRDKELLFDTNGNKAFDLSKELFLEWLEIENYKALYYTLKRNNDILDGLENAPLFEYIDGIFIEEDNKCRTDIVIKMPREFKEKYSEFSYNVAGVEYKGMDLAPLSGYLTTIRIDIKNKNCKIEEDSMREHSNSLFLLDMFLLKT